MENLFFKFLHFSKKNGGIELSKPLSLIPILLKGSIFYPFTIVEHILYEKKIHQHQLPKDPIFILGYYRSGTTFLQRLLSLNENWSHINQLQTALPECSLLLGKPIYSTVQFITNQFKVKNLYHKSEWDWRLVGEEDVATSCLINETTPYWAFMFPSMAHHYIERFSYFGGKNAQQDIADWKKDYLKLIKKYSYLGKGKQLLLKSPPNLGKIKELSELFPNAKFIFIHKNPYSVLKSTRRLWDINGKMNFQKNPSREFIDELTIMDYTKSTDRYLRDKVQLQKNQVFEMSYDELIESPEKTLNNLWDTLQIESRESLPSMIQFIKSDNGSGITKHQYELIDYEKTEKYLEKYLKLWNYQRPKNQ